MSRKCYVCNTDKDNPSIKLEIDGYNYGFSIRGFPEDTHEWLVDVLEMQMQSIHDRATKKAISNMQEKFKLLLGLAKEK